MQSGIPFSVPPQLRIHAMDEFSFENDTFSPSVFVVYTEIETEVLCKRLAVFSSRCICIAEFEHFRVDER